MSITELSVATGRHGLYDITRDVAAAVKGSGGRDGIAFVYCPHTTGAITINENTDPDVRRDIVIGLEAAFPDNPAFRHGEGNSAAHLKSSCVGCGQTLPVENSRLVLGTWQGIYFCEFDGPRRRKVIIKVIGG